VTQGQGDGMDKKFCKGCPYKISEEKNTQNSARFSTIFDFDREYLRNGWMQRKSEKHLINYISSAIGKNWQTFESHCTAFLAAFLVVKTIDDLVLWAVSKLAHTLYGIVYVTETYMSEMWVVLQYVCFSYLCCNTVMFFSCVNCVFWTVHCRHLTQIRTQNFATPRRKSIRESGCCRQTLWLAYWHCDMQTVLYSSSSMLE